MKKPHILTLLIIVVALTNSCRHNSTPPTHSAYYWSTTWESDSAVSAFLKANDVRKVYLRFFDVVVDGSGEVTTGDARYILRHAIGLPNTDIGW